MVAYYKKLRAGTPRDVALVAKHRHPEVPEG